MGPSLDIRCYSGCIVGRVRFHMAECDSRRTTQNCGVMCFFVLDFNNQAMNRFVDHQILMSFKEFGGDYHRHYKKYNDPKQTRANNPSTAHIGGTRFYNDSTSSLSNEVSQLTVWSYSRKRTFEVARSLHKPLGCNQMLELHSQPIPEGSQPLYGNEICETILSRQLDYSKDLSWGTKPKSCKTTCASNSSTSFSQAREFELQQVMIEQQ
ncbi:CACTA en-spm transposon protein [Cucumis melo var. makuwa]|uniref:CACTA en-spm transposon protein n=1 Tax=Cucumis melo var. makuwa TaxID=1194695 RepID=A0A5D3D628_CUCMM|nr:CACTA en-spm transposon protein [Cucumis melo var. makuwa]TYK18985.1 CACTA en-spm transposon protein [Cucumis melo var. makuwa]